MLKASTYKESMNSISHNYFTYIITNPKKTVLYTGITNDIERRLSEHFENRGNKSTFAGKYYCYNLFYYERYSNINHAIEREKEIKLMRRSLKEELIKTMNPNMDFIKL